MAIGIDAKRISGHSMHRGGITAARLAGVDEDSVYIQSGHGQHRLGGASVYRGTQRRGRQHSVNGLGQGPVGQTVYGLGVRTGHMGVEIECVMLKDSIRNGVIAAGAVEAGGPRPLIGWAPHSISQQLASRQMGDVTP